MVEHLPRGNAAARELHGLWPDDTWILHDVSSQLRSLFALTYNIWKDKGKEPLEATLLPTPLDDEVAPVDEASRQVIEQQQRELLAIVSRPNPC